MRYRASSAVSSLYRDPGRLTEATPVQLQRWRRECATADPQRVLTMMDEIGRMAASRQICAKPYFSTIACGWMVQDAADERIGDAWWRMHRAVHDISAIGHPDLTIAPQCTWTSNEHLQMPADLIIHQASRHPDRSLSLVADTIRMRWTIPKTAALMRATARVTRDATSRSIWYTAAAEAVAHSDGQESPWHDWRHLSTSSAWRTWCAAMHDILFTEHGSDGPLERREGPWERRAVTTALRRGNWDADGRDTAMRLALQVVMNGRDLRGYAARLLSALGEYSQAPA